MSRTVATSLLNKWASSSISPFFAAEFLLDSAPVRFWTGYGNRTINSELYLGSGDLMNIDGIKEVADLSAQAITITLSGLTSEIISLALQEPYQRRICNVYLGDCEVSEVVNIFSGKLNKFTLEDGPENSSIKVLIDSKLVEAQSASNRRYTGESQKSRYPSDTFFDYVSGLQDTEIVWGRNSA